MFREFLQWLGGGAFGSRSLPPQENQNGSTSTSVRIGVPVREKRRYGVTRQEWLRKKLESLGYPVLGSRLISLSETTDGAMCITIYPHVKRVLMVSPTLAYGKTIVTGFSSALTFAAQKEANGVLRSLSGR